MTDDAHTRDSDETQRGFALFIYVLFGLAVLAEFAYLGRFAIDSTIRFVFVSILICTQAALALAARRLARNTPGVLHTVMFLAISAWLLVYCGLIVETVAREYLL